MLRYTIYNPLADGDAPCAACKVFYGATCCERKHGEGPRFPMTFNEATRLAKRKHTTLAKAVVISHVAKEEQDELRSAAGDDVANMIVDGVGLYLPEKEDGKCLYLGPNGCTVPNIKPHLCRMFPFRYTGYEWIVGSYVVESGFCYGQDAGGLNVAKTMEIFRETPSTLDAVFRQWERDRKLHAKQMRRQVL